MDLSYRMGRQQDSGLARGNPACRGEDDDHSDGAQWLDGSVQEYQLVQRGVDDLEVCNGDGSASFFSLQTHGQQDLRRDERDLVSKTMIP